MEISENEVHGVDIIEPGILCISHAEQRNAHVIDAMFKKAATLTAEWGEIYVVMIMPKDHAPAEEVRERIKTNLANLQGRVMYKAFVAEDSVVLTKIFRFVASVNPYWQYSLHKSKEEALARIKEVRAQKGHDEERDA